MRLYFVWLCIYIDSILFLQDEREVTKALVDIFLSIRTEEGEKKQTV